MTEPRIAASGLLPHPPIVVPEVGRDAGEACRATTRACARFARQVVEERPDRLFLVSPHSPRTEGAFGLWSGERLRGSLARFHAPGSTVDLPGDPELRGALAEAATERGLRTWSIPEAELDHGAVVPLRFLVEAGWAGPTVVASLPREPRPAELVDFGLALARAVAGLPGSAALVASGDMSHRLTEGAPGGHHPRAIEFDRAVVALVEEGPLEGIGRIPATLRALAGEDVVDSSALVIAALPGQTHRGQVVSYEHPFGVGYLVAFFRIGRPAGERRS